MGATSEDDDVGANGTANGTATAATDSDTTAGTGTGAAVDEDAAMRALADGDEGVYAYVDERTGGLRRFKSKSEVNVQEIDAGIELMDSADGVGVDNLDGAARRAIANDFSSESDDDNALMFVGEKEQEHHRRARRLGWLTRKLS